MEKFTIPPNQSGYSVADGNEVVSVKLDGGLSRSRRDIIGATSLVTVVWSLNPERYEYFRAFFNGSTRKGSLPFLLDLLLDYATLTEHECKFIPESVRLSEQDGLDFTVSANLEVVPINNEDFDESYALIYSIYGEDRFLFLNELEILLNVQLPGSLV